MNKTEIQLRLKQLAIKTRHLCLKMPSNTVNKVYNDQVVRSAASSGANYRAACTAKSIADFINKLRIAQGELDESIFFYELLAEFNPAVKDELREL